MSRNDLAELVAVGGWNLFLVTCGFLIFFQLSRESQLLAGFMLAVYGIHLQTRKD